jgi:prepilin-type N-terminal cleavage/methylation domain-containing protein
MKFASMLTSKRRAYTLIEVLAVLIIISIVSSIVLPGATNFYSGTRVKSEAEIFVQNVRLTRYRAIEEQALYRLIFETNGVYENYKIQTHRGFDPDSGITYTGAFELATYFSVNWADVDEEVMIDPAMTVLSDLPQVIYFWPNGQIYYSSNINVAASTISEHFIAFQYGSAGIRAIVNALGVFSSESYGVDDLADAAEVPW